MNRCNRPAVFRSAGIRGYGPEPYSRTAETARPPPDPFRPQTPASPNRRAPAAAPGSPQTDGPSEYPFRRDCMSHGAEFPRSFPRTSSYCSRTDRGISPPPAWQTAPDVHARLPTGREYPQTAPDLPVSLPDTALFSPESGWQNQSAPRSHDSRQWPESSLPVQKARSKTGQTSSRPRPAARNGHINHHSKERHLPAVLLRNPLSVSMPHPVPPAWRIRLRPFRYGGLMYE